MDIERKQGIPEIVSRITQAERDVRKLQSATMELDPLHQLGGLDDVKRKATISEIIRRLTKIEEDIRKLKNRI